MLSGRGLCKELIPRPEESYRLWCAVVCDLETSCLRRPWPTGEVVRQEQTFAPSDESIYFGRCTKLVTNISFLTFFFAWKYVKFVFCIWKRNAHFLWFVLETSAICSELLLLLSGIIRKWQSLRRRDGVNLQLQRGGCVVSNGLLLQLAKSRWPNIGLLNFRNSVPCVYCPITLSKGQLGGVLFFYVPAKCFWCAKPEYLIAVLNTESNFMNFYVRVTVHRYNR